MEERLYEAANKMYECIARRDIMGLTEVLETNTYDNVCMSIEYLACYLFNKYIKDNPEALDDSEIIRIQEKYTCLRRFQGEHYSPFHFDVNLFSSRYFAGKLLHLIFQGDKNACILFETLIFADTVKFDRHKIAVNNVMPKASKMTTDSVLYKNYLCTVINSAIKYENTGILNRIIDYWGKSIQNDDSDEYNETKIRAAFCFQFLNKSLIVDDIIELKDNFGLDFFNSDKEAVMAAIITTAAKKYNSFRFYKQFNIKYSKVSEKYAEEIAKEVLYMSIKTGGI